MSENWTGIPDKLFEAVSETLEGMAFAETEYTEEPFNWQDEAHYWSSITLEQPVSGRMTLVMPGELVEQICDACYDDVGDEQVKMDVVKELSNTVAGNLMAHVTDNEQFELGLPDSGRGSSGFEGDRFVFAVDDEVTIGVVLSRAH